MTTLDERATYSPTDVHPLKQVLNDLKASALAPYIRIFGASAITPWEKLPKEITAFIDANEIKMGNEDRKMAIRELLTIAENNYGSFMPYLLITQRVGPKVFEQVLWTRNVHANGWVVAKNKGQMTAAGRAGTPLSALVI